ncbi:MAG: DUF5689 domain-containing protein [Marinoscillum sp.]
MKLQTQLLGLFLLVLGCTDKNELPAPVNEKSSVSFSLTTIHTNESADTIEIFINLDQKLQSAATLDIALSGSAFYGFDYVTVPEAVEDELQLSIAAGAQTASIKVIPIEDDLFDGEKSIRLNLINPSSNLILGTKKTLSLKIADVDEQPTEQEVVMIEYVTHQGQMLENETSGYEVLLTLSAEVAHTELVFIEVQSDNYEYGIDYFTNPMTIDGTLRLDVLPGETSVSFMLFPINSNVVNGTREITFYLSDVSDGLAVGSEHVFTLVVEDDDDQSSIIHPINELRQQLDLHYGSWFITGDYFIEGVITSAGNVVNNQTVYIQDETGGIMLIFNGPGLHAMGTKVRLNLRHAIGEMVDFQKGIVGIEDREGVTLGTGIIVAPIEIDLQLYYTGAYQGMRVKLVNLTLTENTNQAKWLGSRRFHGPDGRYINITTNPTAQFKDFFVPTRAMNIIGIAGGNSELLPQTVVDFAFYE